MQNPERTKKACTPEKPKCQNGTSSHFQPNDGQTSQPFSSYGASRQESGPA
jgi:hypothetical protein